MKDPDPSVPTEDRLRRKEFAPAPGGVSPDISKTRADDLTRREQLRPAATEPKQLKIVVHVAPAESQPTAEVPPLPQTPPSSEVSERKLPADSEPQPIPARMLNEFVYCQRLFYYEFVEGVFVESADTMRGEAIHQRVDSGSGALPKAKKKSETEKPREDGKTTDAESASKATEPQSAEPETIHSRSVQMGSERLGVVAKMDLVEVRATRADSAAGEGDDLFSALEVCPVDYKAGAPKEGEQANELWDTDKMQLGLQALILRDNGYTCNEGIIYYRATKQRVRLPITSELETWILQNIAEAR